MLFKSEILHLEEEFEKDINLVKSTQGVVDLRVKYLGRKGKVILLMQGLKSCAVEEIPINGKLINEFKERVTLKLDELHTQFSGREEMVRLEGEHLDITLPGRKQFLGRYHPVTMMLKRVEGILIGMGFSVQYGPDLESDFYNFEALNFPKGHPAREMQDTFYINDELLLRTHTSNVQVRVMEGYKPPIRVISPGRCFRNETVSARSHIFFNQVEVFYIDEHVTFADLMSLMGELWSKIFEVEVKTRFRPSYFPFVEPGMEVDISCTACNGVGCNICKNTGWLEVVGAGMIHPEVLKAGGIDSDKYQGYAFAIGIERLAMLYYGVKDIRYFTENDMRLLEQFA
jgi:phenylalanyl-tRNA synthetase alpha chain